MSYYSPNPPPSTQQNPPVRINPDQPELEFPNPSLQSLQSPLVESSKQQSTQHLTQEQQSIVEGYLQSVQNKQFHDLIEERDQLLEELRSINAHLNQMISQVYGDMQQISFNSPSYHQQSLQKVHKSTPFEQITTMKQKQSHPCSEHQLFLIQLKNSKMIKSLNQQLEDYQFMLTGEYFQKLEQQIFVEQSHKKELQLQVSSLDRQVNKHTRIHDKETISKLERSSYDQQVELTLISKKLQAKILKLLSIQTDNLQKTQKVKSLAFEQTDLVKLLSMYEDEEFEGHQTGRKKKESYEKLQTKKEKLEKIINSYNNNHLKLYNKKLSDFRDLDLRIQNIKDTIKQIDYDILFISKERRQFQENNRDILLTNNKFKSLNNVRKVSVWGQSLNDGNELVNLNKKSRKSDLRQFNHPKSQKNTVYRPTVQNQEPSHSINQQKDSRRRFYTQLQNSHYFSSLQRSKFKRNNSSLEDQEQQPIVKSKIRNHINQRSMSHIKASQYAPSTNQPQIRSNPIVSLQFPQKRFNLSNTPLNSQLKTEGEERSSSYQEASAISLNKRIFNSGKSSFNRSNKDKSAFRKGISNQLERQSEDQIGKRLMNLENLIKKEDICLEAVEQKSFQESVSKSFQRSTNKQIASGKRLIKQAPRRFSLRQKNIKSRVKSNNGSEYYKELCQKLGKDRLLIQEDEDISSLIYQGMAQQDQM